VAISSSSSNYQAELLHQDLVSVRDDGNTRLDRDHLEVRDRSDDDVLHFVVANLRRLSPETQSLLRAAPFPGESFGQSLLENVVAPESRGTKSIKDLAMSCAEKGILLLK
jgi:predicted ATPase